MIKDLQLLENITPLFEKKIVLWGLGVKGRMFLEELENMGAGKKGILLCDTDNRLWGQSINGYKIFAPDELFKHIVQDDICNFIILVTVASIEAQDEIIKSIEKEYGDSIDIYTEYAVKWGIYFNIRHPYIEEKFRKEKITIHEENKRKYCEAPGAKENILGYLAFSPLYHDEMILIYQAGKVASTSLYLSIQNYGRHVLHVHALDGIGDSDHDLYDLLNMKSAKIISLIREPVGRQISAMWQNIPSVNRYSPEVDLAEIEEFYFTPGFENEEFEWFNQEMKKILNIDVFAHPFDKESGYSIIKQGNIELLLLKVEKLDKLKDIVGEFLGIQHFQLENKNVGCEKSYRFALHTYKENFFLSQEMLEKIYKRNEYMKYFYTEEEREMFYHKWLRT